MGLSRFTKKDKRSCMRRNEHNYKIERPDIPAWPLMWSELNLSASESTEQENCKQNQEDDNPDSNVQLCAADIFIGFNVFSTREARDEAFGKTLNDGESQHGSCDLIYWFRQEARCKHSLYYASAGFYQVCSDQTSPARSNTTIDKK